ncbi:hypothetical protein EHQ68_10365 [Leptospira congkakensis]|uniref:Uncharacterized protein n=1 Tax=Leptospira congkakensis TaxID=2484932 RepID=A0A4Z1A2T4_9LEPT|nr:hypothetical protein [Leptospira congkakensis]TGL88220.1 hypothetical protein EHQ68_10365 [Leptospira congkakensis]TGL95325.1 hypothetical protein EHQ69_02550 [Leptospira congkakensis]TGL96407.1 hypothetical protein EHQ70_09600 [Leptospira congkakensis]
MKRISVLYFFVLVSLALRPDLLLARETKATKLELEAESYEERGFPKKAAELRTKIKGLRENQFRKKNHEPDYPITSNLPATNNGSLEFNQGTWEIGFRLMGQGGFFTSGNDWANDDGRVTFQAGTPYFPRSAMGYQNIRSLPFTYDIEKQKGSSSFSPKVAYKHKSAKWGLEYVYFQFQTSNDYLSYGFIGGAQSAYHSDRLNSAEHKLVVKIYEEYSKDFGYSWDFGIRTGAFQTNSVFSSQSLGQTGIMRDTMQYIAPSAGFRFYHRVQDDFSYDIGGDMFVTPLGRLNYRRDIMTGNGGLSRFAESQVSRGEAYSLFSEKPLQTSVVGIDILAQANWQPLTHHKFQIGIQAIQYIWRANESSAPGIRSLNEESFLSGVRDYYLSSAFYEADGTDKRSSRIYAISNIFIGYTYVF